jgi:hypothetical protein
LGGTPVFVGTRVPIKTLLDYLEAGDSLDEFLDHFPSVSREQAITSSNNSILFDDETEFLKRCRKQTQKSPFSATILNFDNTLSHLRVAS